MPNEGNSALPFNMASAASFPIMGGIGSSGTAMDRSIENAPDVNDELDRLTEALSVKFEELSLIHQLSEQLKLEDDPSQLCQSLLSGLVSCISAGTLVIQLFEDDEFGIKPQHYSAGNEVSTERIAAFASVVTETKREASPSVFVDNHVSDADVVAISHQDDDGGEFGADLTHRVIVVTIRRQRQVLGQMIAIRRSCDPEFGSVEADLMKSTSILLGVHLVNQRQFQAMQQMFEGMIGSLASALDAKDNYTSGHSTRVADLSVELARGLGFDDESIGRIHMAGILHDIGKIGVKDSVLCKPGQLTDDEFEQIKQHPVIGFDILSGIRPFRKILPAVRHHHESWDGTGYPDGLLGCQIPRDAQVLAVADAFDAMTSDRPYRSGMPLERVIEIFQRGRGIQWAADVVDVLLASPEVMHAYSKRDRVTA
ncbi:Cyclic di-GMP phosphodiesterase response regulator RpfG [Rubripirellula tenax]|uniref:Cyclic di-GMP phosphodiesterase response regulator RpfG n=1 Tax=Rubripirellula tenax TaxID=2528015 RepID=A0A5C6EIJ3_9BACT|nr:HD-GYP domain-containing protein [Rubripirellula tenax]TWU48608.1 Cyclic di-GMP phosphodiesterase response regulator RpfG [Rubripirellula tenax]